MNSLRAVERAVAFEIERQGAALDAGEPLRQETRGWDDVRGATYVMRVKESSDDYRYFPEPDLPPLHVDPSWLRALQAALPELPAARRERYVGDLGLSAYDCCRPGERRGDDRSLRGDRAAGPDLPAMEIANLVTGDYGRALKETAERTPAGLAGRADAGSLAHVLREVTGGRLSRPNAREVVAEHIAMGTPAAELIAARGLAQISDPDAVATLVDEVIAANPTAVADYRAGKAQAAGFLVGQVMKASRGPGQRRPGAGRHPRAVWRRGGGVSMSAMAWHLGGAILFAVGYARARDPWRATGAQGPGRERGPLPGLAGRPAESEEDGRVRRHAPPPPTGPDLGNGGLVGVALIVVGFVLASADPRPAAPAAQAGQLHGDAAVHHDARPASCAIRAASQRRGRAAARGPGAAATASRAWSGSPRPVGRRRPRRMGRRRRLPRRGRDGPARRRRSRSAGSPARPRCRPAERPEDIQGGAPGRSEAPTTATRGREPRRPAIAASSSSGTGPRPSCTSSRSARRARSGGSMSGSLHAPLRGVHTPLEPDHRSLDRPAGGGCDPQSRPAARPQPGPGAWAAQKEESPCARLVGCSSRSQQPLSCSPLAAAAPRRLRPRPRRRRPSRPRRRRPPRPRPRPRPRRRSPRPARSATPAASTTRASTPTPGRASRTPRPRASPRKSSSSSQRPRPTTPGTSTRSSARSATSS